MKKKQNIIYFIVGTRAQFIKIAPIMNKMAAQKIEYQLIFTAQHKENIDEIIELYKLRKPDKVLFSGKEANTRRSFFTWFLKMLWMSLVKSKDILPEKGIVVTHGDTFTAWLAAIMGHRAGCKVAHVESGCRSFNLFNPFPEEISRIITFNFTDIFFCSDNWTLSNVKKYRGVKVNTNGNTLIDGVRFALENQKEMAFSFRDNSYVIVSIHRYENIFTKRFTEFILPALQELSKNYLLVFTLHPTTRERLISIGKYNDLINNKNIILHERFNFNNWIEICQKALFVITDGGSNQEELAYLGVPTLLFRETTERQEGLGRNVVISKFNPAVIEDFVQNYENYRFISQLGSNSPSEVIIKTLLGFDL